MQSLINFFTQMDKQAARAVVIMVAMFFLVFTLIGYGRAYLPFNETDVQGWFEGVRGTVWALPLTISVFCLAAFIGMPQWVLITGAVIAFGPFYGAAYSWMATMISAVLDFYVGRKVGAERLRRFGGELVNRISELVRRKGFVTSFLVRLVPTGPFVIVNMAAGVSRMKFLSFIAGTGLGILPKILIVALVGQGMIQSFAGNNESFIVICFVGAVVTILIMLYVRHKLAMRLALKDDIES